MIPTTQAHAAVESGRLGAYLFVVSLARENGATRITSQELSDATGENPTSVRRDLSQVLGRAGKRGSGYRVDVLEPLLRANVKHSEGGLATIVATRARALARGSGKALTAATYASTQGVLEGAADVDRRLWLAATDVHIAAVHLVTR